FHVLRNPGSNIYVKSAVKTMYLLNRNSRLSSLCEIPSMLRVSYLITIWRFQLYEYLIPFDHMIISCVTNLLIFIECCQKI
ncbi:hypothetical protein L9F63_012031, partial [Diploptera punctata]